MNMYAVDETGLQVVKNDFLSESLTNNTKNEIFSDLYKKYHCSMLHFAKRWLTSDSESEDVVHDCFIKLWQHDEKLNNILSIKNYLFSMVRNRCTDLLHSKSRTGKLEQEWQHHWGNTVANADSITIRNDVFPEIISTMKKLPPRMQEVFRLYYFEGKSYAEIGALLHTKPGTVRNQRNKALQAIQKLLQKQALLSAKN